MPKVIKTQRGKKQVTGKTKDGREWVADKIFYIWDDGTETSGLVFPANDDTDREDLV